MPCTSFVNADNLDLIIVVECCLNPRLQKKLNAQLAHMVDMIWMIKKFHFRLALVYYKDHTGSECNAYIQRFTNNKDEMKMYIRNLSPSDRAGLTHGLADGLELACKLASSGVEGSNCREDACKVCLLLREYGLTTGWCKFFLY